MGRSRVTTWRASRTLISWINAASVDDLPEPVAPVVPDQPAPPVKASLNGKIDEFVAWIGGKIVTFMENVLRGLSDANEDNDKQVAQLLDLAYDNDPDVFDRTIDSHIKNLRKKIRDRAADFDPIRSVYGVGYSFEEENS